eukprot:6620334-Ditylum_brightwellii.AAC.1
MRQKRPSSESKSCDGGIQSWLSQTSHFALHLIHGGDDGDENSDGGIGSRSSHTVHSSWCLRCQKGDKSCNGRIMSSSLQTINSQIRLSASRSSDDR